ncbi:hypothetical protein HK099_004876 [Clydaea vesicula]|uniref:SH3 domain-containing protein n=1 Tax=Clydaea vesicula TaxID=447962 RepID=A0AAD5UAJ3_9FUNG|nr:hypothetical protein HK099_004876 [Clydaea vesicula]
MDYTTLTKEELKAPSPCSPKKFNSLQKACYEKDMKKFKKLLLEKNRDVNKIDSFHRCTALHIAAEFNLLEFAKILLDPLLIQHNMKSDSILNLENKFADPNINNLDDRTSFLLAVKAGHLTMVELLLENQADINATDSFGCCGLHYTILSEDWPLFNFLMSHKIKLDFIDKSGNSLLHHALNKKRDKMAISLLEKGHLPNVKNWEGRTPLHIAVIKNAPAVVKSLLQYGALTDIQDLYDKVPADYIENNSRDGDSIRTMFYPKTEKTAPHNTIITFEEKNATVIENCDIKNQHTVRKDGRKSPESELNVSSLEEGVSSACDDVLSKNELSMNLSDSEPASITSLKKKNTLVAEEDFSEDVSNISSLVPNESPMKFLKTNVVKKDAKETSESEDFSEISSLKLNENKKNSNQLVAKGANSERFSSLIADKEEENSTSDDFSNISSLIHIEEDEEDENEFSSKNAEGKKEVVNHFINNIEETHQATHDDKSNLDEAFSESSLNLDNVNLNKPKLGLIPKNTLVKSVILSDHVKRIQEKFGGFKPDLDELVEEKKCSNGDFIGVENFSEISDVEEEVFVNNKNVLSPVSVKSAVAKYNAPTPAPTKAPVNVVNCTLVFSEDGSKCTEISGLLESNAPLRNTPNAITNKNLAPTEMDESLVSSVPAVSRENSNKAKQYCNLPLKVNKVLEKTIEKEEAFKVVVQSDSDASSTSSDELSEEVDVLAELNAAAKVLMATPLKKNLDRVENFILGSHKQLENYDKMEKTLIDTLSKAGLQLQLEQPLNEVDIRNIQESIEDLQAEIGRLEGESESLRLLIKSEKNTIEEKEKRINDLKLKISSMEFDFRNDSKSSQVNMLTEELSIKSLQLQKCLDKVEKLNGEALIINKELSNNKVVYNQMKMQNSDLLSQINKMDEEKTVNQDEIEKLKLKISELLMEIELMKKYSEEIEKSNVILEKKSENANDSKRSSITSVVGLMFHRESNAKNAKSNELEYEEQLVKLNLDLEKAYESIELLSIQNEAFKLEISDKKNIDAKFKELQQEYDFFKSSIKSISADLIKTDVEDKELLEILKTEFNSVKQNAAKLIDMDDLKLDLRDVEELNTKLEKKLMISNDVIKNLTKENKDLIEKCLIIESDLTSKVKNLEDHLKKIFDLKSVEDQSLAKIEYLNNKISDLESSLNESKLTNLDLNLLNHKIEEKLSVKTGEIKLLENEVLNLKTVNDLNEKKLQNSDKQLDSCKKEIELLNGENKRLLYETEGKHSSTVAEEVIDAKDNEEQTETTSNELNSVGMYLKLILETVTKELRPILDSVENAVELEIGYVKFSYVPEKSDELALTEGQLIKLTEKPDGGWWEGIVEDGEGNNLCGWFPSDYFSADISILEKKKLMKTYSIEETQQFRMVNVMKNSSAAKLNEISKNSVNSIINLYTKNPEELHGLKKLHNNLECCVSEVNRKCSIKQNQVENLKNLLKEKDEIIEMFKSEKSLSFNGSTGMELSINPVEDHYNDKNLVSIESIGQYLKDIFSIFSYSTGRNTCCDFTLPCVTSSDLQFLKENLKKSLEIVKEKLEESEAKNRTFQNLLERKQQDLEITVKETANDIATLNFNKCESKLAMQEEKFLLENKKQISQFNQQIKHLKDNLSECEASRLKYETAYNELVIAHKNETKATKEENDNLIKDLRKKNFEKENDINVFRLQELEIQNNLNHKIQALRNELDVALLLKSVNITLSARSSALQEKVTVQENRIHELDFELGQLRAEEKRLSSLVSTLNSKNDEIQNKLEIKLTEKEQLIDEIKKNFELKIREYELTTEDAREKCSKKLREKDEIIEETKNKLEIKLREDIEQAKRGFELKLTEKDNDTMKLQKMLNEKFEDDLRVLRHKFDRKLNEKDKDFDELQKTSNTALKEKEDAMRNSSLKLSEARSELEKSFKTTSDLEKVVVQQQSNIENLERKVVFNTDKLKNQDSENVRLKNLLEDYKLKSDKLESKILEAKMALNAINDERRVQSSEIDKIKLENSDLRKEKTRLIIEIQNARNEFHNAEFSKMEERKKQTDTTITEKTVNYTNEINQKKMEVENLKVEQLMKENFSLKLKLERAKKKAEKLEIQNKEKVDKKLLRFVQELELNAKERAAVEKQKEINKKKLLEANEKQISELSQELNNLKVFVHNYGLRRVPN